MDRSALTEIAEQLLMIYRDLLHVDPFYRIKIEIVEGHFISLCEVEESSAATWLLKLNPAKHEDVTDIQMSIIDCLLRILFRYIPNSKEVEEVMARLTTSFAELLPNLFGETEELAEEDVA